MALFTRKTAILAGLEATAGVDVVPTGAANALVIRNATLVPLDLETVKREQLRPYFNASYDLVVGQKVTLDFEIEIAGAGTSAVSKPQYDCLLQACGLSSTINATTSVDYAPVSSGFKTVTIYVFIDGIKHALTGAMGTVDFEFTAKQIPVMKFKFVGLYTAPSDSTNPTMTTTAWQMPLAVNYANTSGFNLHGYAGLLQSLSISLSNSVIHRNLVGAEYITISDRDITGSCMIQLPDTLATKNFYTAALTAVQSTLALTHGTAAFNKFQVAGSLIQLTKPTLSDSDGIRMIQFGLNFIPSSAGNDEVKFSTL